jgi:hypothetical protein
MHGYLLVVSMLCMWYVSVCGCGCGYVLVYESVYACVLATRAMTMIINQKCCGRARRVHRMASRAQQPLFPDVLSRCGKDALPSVVAM